MTRTRTRKQLNASLVLSWFAVSAGLSAQAEAHSGDRLFPIPELTGEMLEKIQLNDGSVDEWYDLAGEPTMSLVDFRMYGTIPDPSDLDFRIWLAWHDDPDRLYVAFSATDDVYFEPEFGFGNDIELQLTIDGDHSGGNGYSNFTFDEAEGVWGEAQQYSAMARTATGDPALLAYYTSSTGGRGFFSDLSEDSWTLFPPFGDVGGDIAGENPIITVIELYVTPYDSWQGYDSGPEGAVVTDLTAGETIGFAIIVSDEDGEDTWYPLTPEAVRTDDPRENLLFLYRADLYLDGLLLPANPTDSQDGSAVESMTWGRIKAALAVE